MSDIGDQIERGHTGPEWQTGPRLPDLFAMAASLERIERKLDHLIKALAEDEEQPTEGLGGECVTTQGQESRSL